jgi:hypothetical protein
VIEMPRENGDVKVVGQIPAGRDNRKFIQQSAWPQVPFKTQSNAQ